MESNEIKFTEDKYLTKEEVMTALNLYNIDFIWEKILNYRKNFSKTVELSNVDNSKYSLTLTKTITKKVLKLEKLYTKALLNFSFLDTNYKMSFRMNRLVNLLSLLMSSNNIDQSNDFLSNIISGSLSTLPNDCVILSNYIKAVKFIEKFDKEKISYEELNSLYLYLTTGDYSSIDSQDKIYRTTSIETPHYYQKGYVYQEALANRIEAMVNQNVEYINNEEEFSFIKAIVSLFYIDYIKPYDLFRNEIDCLYFKLILNTSGYSMFSIYSGIEKLMLFKDDSLEKAKRKVQKTNDLTYYVDYVLDFLIDDTQEILDLLNQVKESEVSPISTEIIKEEVNQEIQQPRYNGNDIIQDGLNNAYDSINKNNSDSFIQNNIYSKPNVALPVFPSGLQEKDIEKITNDLLETYPNMKYSQAHFYAGHCTIGRSYTISQFKNSEKTSYETARTSMDYLVNIGFYQKTSLKNKFVYKPVPRNNNFDND